MNTYTTEEIEKFDESRQAKCLTEKEKNYLLDKLEYATISFYEMLDHDKYFALCVSKLEDESEAPGDHIYMHMWERRVSGRYKTQEQHQATINMVIESLDPKELEVLNKFGGSIFATSWNHFIHSEDGILLYTRLKEYFENKYNKENSTSELPFDIDKNNIGRDSIYAHLKEIFPDKNRSEIEYMYKTLTREDNNSNITKEDEVA
jgi:hypothetical protein